VKYIEEQIKDSSFNVEQIDQYYVRLGFRYNSSFNPNFDDHVKFIITLGKGFPATAPQLHIANTFVHPSLRSYGDYLKAALKKEWSITSKLREITESLPLFVEQLQKETDYLTFAQTHAQYHNKRIYSYSLLRELS
jgi:ubiquitin-protein ligase